MVILFFILMLYTELQSPIMHVHRTDKGAPQLEIGDTPAHVFIHHKRCWLLGVNV